MVVHDIFSRREDRERENWPDVYQYDEFSGMFREQLIHMITENLGSELDYRQHVEVTKTYQGIVHALRKEHGRVLLSNSNVRNPVMELQTFIRSESDVARVLDAVEMCFAAMEEKAGELYYKLSGMDPDEAVKELNFRLREHGYGYRLESGKIVRISSDYTHEEIVRPALYLMRRDEYRSANEEFFTAIDRYRERRYGDCLVECSKALESTMKTICSRKNWEYDERDTASKLIAICIENGLIPEALDSHFQAIRAILESGVPMLRNKSGHGRGEAREEVTERVAAFGINSAASAILLLAESAAKSEEGG